MVTKVHLLLVARRICEKFVDTRPDGVYFKPQSGVNILKLLTDYVVVSVELAQEYVNLGKVTKAGNIYLGAMNLAKKMPLSEETRVMLSLRFAEAQAAAGNILKRCVNTVFTHPTYLTISRQFISILRSLFSIGGPSPYRQGTTHCTKDSYARNRSGKSGRCSEHIRHDTVFSGMCTAALSTTPTQFP